MYVQNLLDSPFGEFKNQARLMIVTFVDGEKFSEQVFASGPRPDINDYYDGKITLKELYVRLLGKNVLDKWKK